MDIAALIDDAMRKKRLNQPKLAALSGVPQATISRTLKNVSIPATKTLIKLFTALDIPVSLIEVDSLDDAGDKSMQANEPNAGYHAHRRIPLAPQAVTLDLDADCLLVWQQLQQLPPDERERWRAELDIAAGQARLAKLAPKKQAPANPPDKSKQPAPKAHDPA